MRERTWRRPKYAVQKPAAAAAPVYSVADDDAGSNDPLILEKSYTVCMGQKYELEFRSKEEQINFFYLQ